MFRVNSNMISGNEESIEICTKHDISLYMIKNDMDTKFRLTFTIHNDNFNLKNAIGFKLFALMGELNTDVIDKIYMDEYENDTKSMDIGILLKRFGKEFGIAQKYLFVKTDMICSSKDTSRFVSKQIDPPKEVIVPAMSESVIKTNTVLDVTLHTSHKASVTYDFSFVIEDDLPIYMEKYPGLLMKKIFVRLKTFLENINENT